MTTTPGLPSATPLETNLESLFYNRIRAVGGRVIKLVPLRKGEPDRLVLMPHGLSYLVELKKDGGRRSPAQKVIHDRYDAIGHTVVTLYGRAEILNWIRRITDDQYYFGRKRPTRPEIRDRKDRP